MVLKNKVVRELNLPQLPSQYKKELNSIIDSEVQKGMQVYNSVGAWHIDVPDTIKFWLEQNIQSECKWYCLIFNKDSPLHKDVVASTRLSYYLDLAMPSIQTLFYDNLKKSLLEEIYFRENQWYLVKTDVWHTYNGMRENTYRKILTARIMEQIVDV